MTGEKIYEYDVDVTGMTDFGVSLEEILAGSTPIPPQGLRLDIAFEGTISGRISGRVSGIDYTRIRADGRIDADIRGIVETSDGRRIALSAGGTVAPRGTEPIGDVSENVTLNTIAEDYAWVNTRQIWGTGTVDFSAGKVHVDGYMQ